MKSLISLLVSLTWLSGVLSSDQLVQSDPEVITPGNSHTLTCQGSGGFTIRGNTMGWIRQFSDGKLQWLCIIYSDGDTRYNDVVKGRFTVTRDDNINKLTLKMDNMKPEDTAVYFCARQVLVSGRVYSWAFDIWGSGTKLVVSAASSSAPSLFPLISCATPQDPSTTIGCLATNFLPSSIDFSWTNKINSSFSEGLLKHNPVLQSGGTYAASSQIKVPTDSWVNNEAYYCTAKHSVDNKSVLLQYPYRHVEKKPTVTIHPPFKDDLESNGNGTIVCIAKGFFPKPIEVKWQKSHEIPLESVTEEAIPDGNGGFIITSFIIVSKEDWDRDYPFSCIVNHPKSDFHEIKNVSKSTVCENEVTTGEIKITVEAPSFETIYFQKSAPLICIISNMENKDGLEAYWQTNGEKIHTELEDPRFDSLRRYHTRAIATVCPEDWKTKTFECIVSHPELPRVTSVQLSKPNGDNARPPLVLLFPPHQDELLRKERVSLACLVKSFSPDDIFVRWMNSDNVEQTNVITTKPMEEITSSQKKTYFLLSTLTLQSVEEWYSGKGYSCIVGHESLPLQVIQRTVDKHTGKPTHMNVSLIMSDSC